MLSDDERFELHSRIKTVRSSVQRSRLAFLALNLASLALLLLVWNCYFSWFRFLVTPNVNPTTEFLKAELVRNWVRSLWTPAGIVGVTIGVADTSLLGSLMLLMLTIWFYFSSRRENHTTARLLDDTLKIKIASIRRAVFWAIADEHIFLSWVRIDKPAGAILALRADHGDTRLVEAPDRVVRGALGLMMFLPFYTICIAWAMDVYSLTQPSLFRDPARPLYTQLHTTEWLQVVAILVFAGIFALLLRNLLLKVGDFNTDTVEQLRRFALKVDEIPNPPDEVETRSSMRRLRRAS